MKQDDLTEDQQKEITKLHAEQYNKLNEETQEQGFSPIMNRAERRKKLPWLKKQLVIHNKRKPNISYKPDEDLTDEKAQSNIAKMKAWATRYGILMRKINELENYGS